MTQQPLALQLADSADACQLTVHDCALVAKELRRLHEENERLKVQVDRMSYRLAYPGNFEREWLGLTEEEIEMQGGRDYDLRWFARAIEAKLKERNQ